MRKIKKEGRRRKKIKKGEEEQRKEEEEKRKEGEEERSKAKITAGRRGRKDRARYYIDDTEGSQPEFEEFNESVDFAGGNMIHTLYTPPQ